MSNLMKRIGFVDKNLDNFHANTYLAAVHGPLAGRGYRVVGATAVDAESGRCWAVEKGVRYFETVGDLEPHVDCFMILAPADSALHLPMCRDVLPSGKATFVDKTFAPSVEVAEAIFKLADAHGAPIQTTSALRSTDVQQFAREVREEIQNVYVWGGGDTFEEYGVHPVEMAVSCLGADVGELLWGGRADHPQILLRYRDGRNAVVDFSAGAHVDYWAAITTKAATEMIKVDLSRLFVDAASLILDFFDAGVPLVERAETLLIHRVLEFASGPEVSDVRHKGSGLHSASAPTRLAARRATAGKLSR